MHILIVGGGLGGLTAALCLSRSRENTVELLELRPDLSPAGGGLQVRPPASRLLHAWGLRGDLARAAEDTSAAVYRDLGTGEVATRAVAAREEGAGVDWGVRRRDLVALLYGKIKGEERVKVRFGACAVGVRDGDGDGGRAAVRVREGDRGHESEVQVEADLVLVADGIRSRLRAQVLQDLEGDFEPLLSELTLYGVDLPLGAAELRANPALRPLAAQGATHLNVYLGRGLWVVTRHYPKLGRQSLLFGVRGATDQTGLWDEKGDLGFVKSCFADACPELRAALESAQVCDRWRLAEMPELPRWTSKGGRVVLLGDSAHGMHPNAAQGYSQIVEDIGVLEYLISQANSTPSLDTSSDSDSAAAQVPQITAAWEEIRKPRVRRIQEWARFNSALFTGEVAGNLLRGSRQKQKNTADKNDNDNDNEKMEGGGDSKSGGYQVRSLENITPDMNGDFNSSAFLKWTQSYDAVDEARKYLQGKKSRL